MKQKMYVLATLIVVFTLFLSGCTSSISGSNIKSDSKIKDIITDPGKYEGSEVTVSGKVINVVDLRPELRSYKINDGSASIEIISDTVPKMGDQVTAKGIVKAGQSVVFIDARGIISDVKATPQITPATPITTLTPIPTPIKAASGYPSVVPGALITGKIGDSLDLGSGYILGLFFIDLKTNGVLVTLNKFDEVNGFSKVADGTMFVDKPLILGNAISLNLKSVYQNESNQRWFAQFTYNFLTPIPTTTPTIPLTQGNLIAGETGKTFDLGSGYNLEIVSVSNPKIEGNSVWVLLKKDGVKVEDGIVSGDKPLILGNVISLNLKSINMNVGKTAYVAQITYNFI